MKKLRRWRVMLQAYIKYFITGCLVLATIPALAIASKDSNELFIEGQDYIRLSDKIRKNSDVAKFLSVNPNKIQVVFFFNYGCHACEAFNKPFEKWLDQQQKQKNNKMVIYKFPVSFNSQWEMLAKLYFVMESLDPKMRLNDDIFDAIHKQGLRLWQEPVMKKFFVQHGYTESAFDRAFSSPVVAKQVKRADDLSKGYEITATPDIVVNGPVSSYMLNVVKAGNNVDKLFQILNYVIRREAKLLED